MTAIVADGPAKGLFLPVNNVLVKTVGYTHYRRVQVAPGQYEYREQGTYLKERALAQPHRLFNELDTVEQDERRQQLYQRQKSANNQISQE